MLISGMAVRGARAGGLISHCTRKTGVFGYSPARMVRLAKAVSGGPTTPRASRIPSMV
jgi:hypothetical protein